MGVRAKDKVENFKPWSDIKKSVAFTNQNLLIKYNEDFLLKKHLIIKNQFYW